jgi:hypothetical protein
MPNRLESYVEELRQELRDLPVTARAEQLVEVRTHLDALKAANLELGLTDEEAEAAAVSQMGQTAKLGKEVRKASWREHWDTAPGVAWVFGWLTWLPTLIVTRRTVNGSFVAWPDAPLLIGPLLLSYLLLGMLLGRVFPKYAARGSVLAIGVILLCDLLFSVVSGEGGFSWEFHGPRFLVALGTLFEALRVRAQKRVVS